MTSPLQHAITTIKAGDYKAGQQLLIGILANDPGNEQAWIWISSVIDSDEHRRQCMERALAINPSNAHVQRALSALLMRWSASLATQQGELQAHQQRLNDDRITLDHEQAIWRVDHQALAESRAALQAHQEHERETAIGQQEWFAWQQQFVDPQHTVLDPPTLKDGVYSLSTSLERLFRQYIKDPYNRACDTQVWKDLDVDNQGQSIIDRGRGDFCKPYLGLSVEDKVLIYCHKNMRMHFF